jgi:hypothetical protein
MKKHRKIGYKEKKKRSDAEKKQFLSRCPGDLNPN